MATARARTPYKYRYRHGLLGLCVGVPLLLVALSGCVLALKDVISSSGILGARDPWPAVYEFHRSLFAGWVGRGLLSMIGMGLWGMVWSGRKSVVRLRGRKLSIHAKIGLSLGIPLAVVTSLGAVLNFVQPLSDWLDPIPAVSGAQESADKSGALFVSPDQLARAHATAAQHHLAGDLVKVYQPKPGRPYLIFYYADNTRLYIDPMGSTLLKSRTSWSHWTSALLPLHALKPLGALGTWLVVMLGLALTSLALVPVRKILRFVLEGSPLLSWRKAPVLSPKGHR